MSDFLERVGFELEDLTKVVLDLGMPYTTYRNGVRSTASDQLEWRPTSADYTNLSCYSHDLISPWRTRVRWHRLVLGAAAGTLCGLAPVGEFLAGEPGSRTLLDLIVVLIWPLPGAVIGVVASVVLPFVIVFGFWIGLLLGLVALPFWLVGLLLEWLNSVRI